MPGKEGTQARTIIEAINGGPYEVVTYDLRYIKMSQDTSQQLIKSMIGKHPFETTVYKLVSLETPLEEIEEILTSELGAFEGLRRDLSRGDLYLSRSEDKYSAALEHDDVVNGIQAGTVRLLGSADRMALIGIGSDVC